MPATLSGTAAVADLNVGLLYYVAGAERIHACVVSARGEPRMFPLMSSDEAFPLIDRLTDTLAGMSSTARKSEELGRFSSGWGKRLLPPAEVLRTFDVITIVPQYLLHGLPLHVVELGDGDYLGSVCGVTYCSSGVLLRLCASRNPARLGERPRRTCATVAGDAIGAQTAAFREVLTAFRNVFDTMDWSGPHARPRLKVCEEDVAVVVCHGHYDDLDPASCGLILDCTPKIGVLERGIVLSSGEKAFFRDLPFHYPPLFINMRPDAAPEFLNIEEFKVEATCNAELVALLGCTTAAGAAAWVDDAGTLAEQWLRAGASSVLGNIWESDVVFVRDWCRRFLMYWVEERRPKALAWSAANRDMISDGFESSLFDWGTLTLWGDWI